MQPRVLLLSSRDDFATDQIAVSLAERSVPFLRLNSEDFVELEVSWRPDGPSLLVCGEELGEVAVESDLQAALVRRPTSLRNVPESPTEALAAHHWLTFQQGLLCFPKLRWMNHPGRDFVAENKMNQLRRAHEIGFRIPETVVTNSTRLALDGCTSPDGFIVKGLDSVSWRSDRRQNFCYSQALERADLQEADLSALPAIVQERLHPKTDIRVTIVGDQLWAASISLDGHPIEGDWRLHGDTVDFREHDLPASVSRRCHELTSGLGLSFAAIDLAISGDDYVYLELNPVGEWSWLAERLGWDVAGGMARWLSAVD